jgi:hypothetical protein
VSTRLRMKVCGVGIPDDFAIVAANAWMRSRRHVARSALAASVALYCMVSDARAQQPNLSCPGQWSDDGQGYRCVCSDGSIAKFSNGTMVCDATVADPNALTWHFQNRTSGDTDVAFYSQDRDYAWPGYNQGYLLNDHNPRTFALSCTPGEHICYGAWYVQDPSGTYWGTGFNNQQYCANCCYTCGSTPPLIPIDP